MFLAIHCVASVVSYSRVVANGNLYHCTNGSLNSY